MRLSPATRRRKIDAYNAELIKAQDRARLGDHEYAAAFYRWASTLAAGLAADNNMQPADRLAWVDRSNHCALEWTRHLEIHRS